LLGDNVGSELVGLLEGLVVTVGDRVTCFVGDNDGDLEGSAVRGDKVGIFVGR
jgi:hypothetical protein